jgi:hypothetical protein
MLNDGGTTFEAEAAMLGSVEFAQTHHDNASFLKALYNTVLGRDVDPGALTAFSKQLDSGALRSSVALTVLTSAENCTPIVQADYQKYLLRAADPSGLTSFVGVMQNGGSEDDVVITLASSAEFAARFGN